MNFFDMLFQIKLYNDLINYNENLVKKAIGFQEDYNKEEKMFVDIMENRDFQKWLDDPVTHEKAMMVIKHFYKKLDNERKSIFA